MKLIKLSRGQYAKVDDIDFDRVSQWKWSFNNGYSHRGVGWSKNQKTIYMHRFILRANKGQYCDHVNGDKLDNRRSNLRLCNNGQNMSNATKRSHNTSGFKGVSWHKKAEKWTACIQANNLYTYLGLFKDKIEAALAYNNAALKYHGEFANLNKLVVNK